MIQLYPNEGLVQVLQRVVVGGVTWRLFTNPITPDINTLLTDLTEAAFAGYAPIPLAWIDFVFKGVASNAGFAFAAPIAFSNGSGAAQTIQGYYVTDTGNTLLLAIGMFDGAPETLPDGQQKLIAPALGDFSSLTP